MSIWFLFLGSRTFTSLGIQMSHFREPFSLLNKLHVNNLNNHVNKSNISIVKGVSLFGTLLLHILHICLYSNKKKLVKYYTNAFQVKTRYILMFDILFYFLSKLDTFLIYINFYFLQMFSLFHLLINIVQLSYIRETRWHLNCMY